MFKPFVFLSLDWGLQKNYLLAAEVNKNLSLTCKGRIPIVHLLWTEEEHVCLLILAQEEVTCMVAYGNISSPLRYRSLSLCQWTDAAQLSGARGVPQQCRMGSLAWHLSMSAAPRCALKKRLLLCATSLLLPFFPEMTVMICMKGLGLCWWDVKWQRVYSDTFTSGALCGWALERRFSSWAKGERFYSSLDAHGARQLVGFKSVVTQVCCTGEWEKSKTLDKLGETLLLQEEMLLCS